MAASQRKQEPSMLKIITKQDGTFGLQRIGSQEVHGSFERWVDALSAAAEAGAADACRQE